MLRLGTGSSPLPLPRPLPPRAIATASIPPPRQFKLEFVTSSLIPTLRRPLPRPLPPRAIATASIPPPRQFKLEFVTSINDIDPAAWDACVTNGTDDLNPSLTHAFLNAMESSKSASRSRGWQPYHLLVRQEVVGDDRSTSSSSSSSTNLVAVVPMYIKSHSFGEYVFDQSWAQFYERVLGEPYYPKLQACIPFTPVPGSRILVNKSALDSTPSSSESMEDQVILLAGRALLQLAEVNQLSSIHLTFLSEREATLLEQLGFQTRVGLQYHLDMRDYKSFDDYTSHLKLSKRRNVKQERKCLAKNGLVAAQLRGDELKAADWDRFYDEFYLRTVDKRGGHAYLTRDFFHRLGASQQEGGLAERVILSAARDQGGDMVAGALHLLGSSTLYGRYWGCSETYDQVSGLHFELCYYQAIDISLQHKLRRIEAGAQGEHKLARGFLPVKTFSSHFIRHPQVSLAVQQFLREETKEMNETIASLRLHSNPFKVVGEGD